MSRITEIDTFEDDFTYNLNDDTPPLYYNRFNRKYNEAQYNEAQYNEAQYNEAQNMKEWDNLFDLNNNQNKEERNASQLIKIAIECGTNYLLLNKVNFKNNCGSSSITKLEKVKTFEIKDSNLEEISYFPPNAEKIRVENCVLKMFDTTTVPDTVRFLSLENNLIELFLDNNNLVNLTELNLSSNKLEFIPTIPFSVIKLNLSNNYIKNIDNLSENINLKYINLNGNSIQLFENIPETIEVINIAKNDIEFLDLSMFSKLKEIRAHSNELQFVENLPETLEYIDFSQNNLNFCPQIGEKIKYLDLSYNKLKTFPVLIKTDNLETFDINSNDDLELTNEVITQMIELKSTVKMCFFDQFQIDQTTYIENDSDNASDSSSSKCSWGCDEDLMKLNMYNSIDSNDDSDEIDINDENIGVENVDNSEVVELAELAELAEIVNQNNNIPINTTQDIVIDVVEHKDLDNTVDNVVIEQVIDKTCKRIEVNIKRIYTL